ncbi:MAG: hypothetical protein JW839_09785 [Candidatus Lokiarchaeota archaeon]|nr:hypothetical protein [Candidatus Lokiarchaeota archaeon]
MTESEVANIIHVVESIENIMRIAEKNPRAFDIDSLKRSHKMALAKLDEAKEKYRSMLDASRVGGESGPLKAYKR